MPDKASIHKKAFLLRQKDLIRPQDANTPARQIYYPILMLYLGSDSREIHYNDFSIRMTRFMQTIRNRDALALCVDISKDVVAGAYFRALHKCKALLAQEAALFPAGDGTGKPRAVTTTKPKKL